MPRVWTMLYTVFFQQLFRPSLKDFHVIIELNKSHIPKKGLLNEPIKTSSSSHGVKLCSTLNENVVNTVLPVVEFDPTRMYLKELQVGHSFKYLNVTSLSELIRSTWLFWRFGLTCPVLKHWAYVYVKGVHEICLLGLGYHSATYPSTIILPHWINVWLLHSHTPGVSVLLEVSFLSQVW